MANRVSQDELNKDAAEVLKVADIGSDANGKHLSGFKIWFGASSHEPGIINLSSKYRTVFQNFGASVNNSDEWKNFEPVVQQQIDESNLIIMLAATPGISARTLEICSMSTKSTGTNRDKLRIYMPTSFSQGFICNRLQSYGLRHINYYDIEAFSSGRELFRKCIMDVCDEIKRIETERIRKEREFAPEIGIITALPREYEAVTKILKNPRVDRGREPGKLDRDYYHGVIRSDSGGEHNVVLALIGKGNNAAAVRATILLNQYSSIDSIFMVGVAAGVPDSQESLHVRLGDIVVCDEFGVIQTDMVKEYTGRTEYNPPPRPPAQAWLTRADLYLAALPNKPRYWSYLDSILVELGISRPHRAPLRDSPWISGRKASKQPTRPLGQRMMPKVHRGRIASANMVLNTKRIRDKLKDLFKIRAFEMESSGIAEAAWASGKGYFVVRGICDFANDDKNKTWQPYAAAAAAAFTRDLIETMPVISKNF